MRIGLGPVCLRMGMLVNLGLGLGMDSRWWVSKAMRSRTMLLLYWKLAI